ncbi:MAG: Rrf2 family transcriptional regulator [Verrucomicrobiales bacterium]|nr:Rrf2 family transcriptional regulator [Verrucomicrobiales bacterium]
MQLSKFTDYSLRVLIYTAARRPDKVSITELAEAYDISRNHLVKVVNELANLGYLRTSRGRGGGILLGHAAEDIIIGDVVEAVEPGFDMAECFSLGTNHCRLTPVCRLKGIMIEAKTAFLRELSRHTLADVVEHPQAIIDALKLEPLASD